MVLSNRLVNETSDLIAVQITSKPYPDLLYFKLMDEDVSPPLLLQSGIRIHKLFTVDQSLVVHKIGTLKQETFKEVLKLIVEKVFEA